MVLAHSCRLAVPATAALVAFSAASTQVLAQNARVIYDHRPGDKTEQRTAYLLPGERIRSDDVGEFHPGPVPSLEVPESGSVCLAVRRANTLLYSYGVAQKAITADAPAGLGDLLAAAGLALGGLSKSGVFGASLTNSKTPKQDGDADVYASHIGALIKAIGEIERIKRESDSDSTLARAVERSSNVLAKADADNDLAEDLYTKHKNDPAPAKAVYDLIRSVHTATWAQLQTAERDIRAAAEARAPEFCVPVKETRVRIALTATRRAKLAEGERAQRPVDTLAIVVADPISNKRFEVVPAFSVAIGLQDARQFALKDGVITSKADRDPHISPGVFALARMIGPVWGSIGVSKGQEKADVFLGLVLRGGQSIVGTNMIMGAGLTLASVPTGLKAATEGGPLPPNVKDIADIIDRKHKPGLGVFFSLSGLSIDGITGGDKK